MKKVGKEEKGYGWLQVALDGVLGVLHDEVRDRATTDWKYMVLALVPKSRNWGSRVEIRVLALGLQPCSSGAARSILISS